ncbi:hypothetical protein [Paenibacillus catalpae]|uniref:hypothetical protein n=1 Tax=Paenibacillus catalpae TaxID=1045775 RepID=UPI000B8130C7|nr:hypothetical protein [Paenibacillus catalpae]
MEKLASSVTIMLALLVSLIILYLGIQHVSKNSISLADRLWVRLPFSLYLGWICVASIVNISVALYASDWNRLGLSEEAWTFIMLAAAALLAFRVGIRYRDWAYTAVFVWAFIAIGINNGDHPVIARSAYVLAAVLLVFALYVLIRSGRRGKM